MFCICELLQATTEGQPAPLCPYVRLWGCHPRLGLVPLLSGEGAKVSCLPTRQGNLLRASPGCSFLCFGAATLSYGATSLGSIHMFTVRLITNILQACMSILIHSHVLKNSPCAVHILHCMDIPSAEAVWVTSSFWKGKLWLVTSSKLEVLRQTFWKVLLYPIMCKASRFSPGPLYCGASRPTLLRTQRTGPQQVATTPFLCLILHRFSFQRHEGKGLEVLWPQAKYPPRRFQKLLLCIL